MGATVDDDVPAGVLLDATCRTPGCPVEGVTFRATFYPNTEPPVYRAVCGRCDQPVTDLVEV